MKGNAKVLVALQNAIAFEAHLNLQYRLGWRVVKFLGANKTADKLKSFGTDAHDWLKMVTDRTMLLGGSVSYTIDEIEEYDTVGECLKENLALENSIVGPYEQAVKTSTDAMDDTTRNLFEHLLKWHENHIAWLEKQARLIALLGEQQYIAEKL